MSVCGQTEDDSTSEEPPGAPVREMYEQKAVSKVVRVLTVLAYLLSVSLAAILLSVYYVCVWKSPDLPPLNDTGGQGELSARRADRNVYYISDTKSYNYSGGSNITVSDETPSESNITSPSNETSEPPVSEYPLSTDLYGSLEPENLTDVIVSSTIDETNVT